MHSQVVGVIKAPIILWQKFSSNSEQPEGNRVKVCCQSLSSAQSEIFADFWGEGGKSKKFRLY